MTRVAREPHESRLQKADGSRILRSGLFSHRGLAAFLEAFDEAPPSLAGSSAWSSRKPGAFIFPAILTEK